MRKLRLEELGRLNKEEYINQKKIPIVVVLDNIRSGSNVGSFFRTSDAFNVDHIVLCGITARPPHKEILKTAIGASQSVSWIYREKVSQAINELKRDKFSIIGFEQTDQSIDIENFEVNTDKKYALVFGNEVDGVSDDIINSLDQALEIPQFGTKHSLNVSVCGGIGLWHFAKCYL